VSVKISITLREEQELQILGDKYSGKYVDVKWS